jgi:transposase
MAKYKPCNYAQMVMLPISLENQLVPGSLEHTINQLVEQKVDLAVFDERYSNDDTGASAIHPKVLLKVVLFAYSRGLISSRQIERACVENITFMALACGHTPDHSTIAAFVSSMKEEVESVFCDVLVVCEELGLLGGSHFSLDGVKLSANVSKEWSGTFEELKHKRDKLQEKVKQIVAEHAQADENPELEKEQQKKREMRLQQQVERLNAFLASEKPKMGRDGKEIQSNVVDNESVKMPTAHGVIQGCNAQALVDAKHQVILAAQAFSTQDHDNLEPMVTGAKKNLKEAGKDENFFRGKELTADSNYHSFNSLTFCNSAGVDAYIPDIQFRKRDERFANQERFKDGIHGRAGDAAPKKEEPFSAEDFKFDAARQVYTCPKGQDLTLHARNQRNRHRLYDIYHARPEDCSGCPVRERCLNKPTTSRRYLSVQVEEPGPNVLDEMKAKIDSARGKKIYARRLGIVEPVFANICVHKHMNRFTLRSKSKVDVQWRLFAIVHNIGKICVFGALK